VILNYVIIICLIFLTTSISLFGVDTSIQDISSPFKQLMVFICLIPIVVYASKDVRSIWYTIKTNKIFIFYVFFMTISITWSVDVTLTLKKLALTIALQFITILLLRDLNNFLKVLKNYFIFVLILSILALLTPYGWMHYEDKGLVAKGIFFHKNYFGRFLCFSSIYFLYFRENTRASNFFLIISIGLLILTRSTTALFILTASIILYFAFRSVRSIKLVVFSTLLIIFFTCFYGGITNKNLFDSAIQVILTANNKDMTFNGRTRLWELLLADGMHRHPILGAGYAAYFKGCKTRWLELMDEFAPGHAHNSYLQVFLELGILGISIIILMILFSLVRNIKILISPNYGEKFIGASFLASLVYGYFDPGLLNFSEVSSILFIAGVLYHQKKICVNFKDKRVIYRFFN
jgi:exopolysaccharide production protein ExoQ